MEPASPIKLKKIDAMNDYVAIMVKTVDSTIEMTSEMKEKFSNEGLAVGVGPEVNRLLTGDDQIKLGDRLVVRGNKYQQVTPKSGCYADEVIMMVHKSDLVIRHSRANPGEYDFTDDWTVADTDAVRQENA